MDAPADADSDATLDAGGDVSVDAASPDASSDAAQDAPVSQFCGDSIRDTKAEECDDGPGLVEDACTATCQAHNYFVVPPTLTDGGAKQGSRTVGRGRHPVAAGPTKSAVAFVEKSGSTHTLRVAFFDAVGARIGSPLDAGASASPSEQAEPVVAALPAGKFVIAWNDLAGGSMDVAMRVVDQNGASSVAVANQSVVGAQRDADLLWTGTELVVAWVDGQYPKVRRFDGNLLALEPESALDTIGTVGGSIAVAGFGPSWAAAWRVIEPSGLESIHARSGATTWSVGPFLPGASLDRPALVSLDATHLLLVFTEGTDPLVTGTASVTRLRGAILDASSPTAVAMFPIDATVEPWASDVSLGQSRPGLALSGTRRYLTWQSESPIGNVLDDEVWFRELVWDGSSLALLPEMPLRADAPRAEAQRAPAIAGSPLWPEGALVTVWEDSTSDPKHTYLPDLVFGLRPTPIVVLGSPDGGGS